MSNINANQSRRNNQEAKIIRLQRSLDLVFQDTLRIRCSEGLLMLSFNEIGRCEANGNYTVVHMDNGRQYIVSKCLKAIAAHLPSTKFIRVHQSHVVPAQEIELISDKTIRLKNGVVIPLSRRYKKRLQASLSLKFAPASL